MDSAASSSSDARLLAAALAHSDEAALTALLSARAVSPTAAWHDAFDAAEALLEPASIERLLPRLSRAQLAALIDPDAAASAAQREALVGLALVRADGSPFGVVAERVAAAAPDTAPLPTPVPAAATALDAAAAAEHAALATAALADLVVHAVSAPPGRTGAGALAAADRKRLVEAGVADDGAMLDDLLASAVAAGLMVADERAWLVTAAGEAWLSKPTPERWAHIVMGVRAGLPAALRGRDGSVLAVDAWPGAYPLDPAWPPRAAELVRITARWGLRTADGAEPVWTASWQSGAPVDTAGFAAQLPGEIDRIYLQADLSAIAPGPLAPRLDLRLRSMAVRESRAQASTYRFTSESLSSAVAAGESAASLRAFLSELSLTGIPQPLDYLIETITTRHGTVRVRTDAETGRTLVEADDDATLDALAVDQSVRPLGFVREGTALASRVGRDSVFWTLVDARYPAVALDGAGTEEPVHRRRLAPTPPAEGENRYARLVAALQADGGGDADAAWLTRELDAAVRARATIVVTAALPDGSTRDFILEATGLGGGRLRGRDRASDTERTLPVSSIVSARPA